MPVNYEQNVSGDTPFKPEYEEFIKDYPGRGSLKVQTSVAKDAFPIKDVFVDGKNCTASLANNRLSFDAVTDDHLVQTVFEGTIDYVNELHSSKVDVTIEGMRIISHNAGKDPLRIFDTKGHLLYEGQSEIYTAPRMGIYIVEVGKNKYKIAL